MTTFYCMKQLVGIVGTRTNTKEQFKAVNELVCNYVKHLPKDTVVVSGGAVSGADLACKKACNLYKVPYLEAVAFWNRPDGTYDRSAGILRNRTIAEVCDRVVAFWDLESKGTESTIHHAEMQRKPVEVYDISGILHTEAVKPELPRKMA